jgi:ABC-type branched-subunit amino acid transport system substrate-binding protein
VVKEIKPLSDEPSKLQDVEEQFNREANALDSLGQHDRIPALFGCFRENGKFYIIQEYIEGQDLSEELKVRRQWSEDEVIELLKDILEVLKVVHQHDIIHRDINPSNLIRRKDRKIALIDFGIVKEIANSTVSSLGQAKKTKLCGTPGYMPNEQATGYPKLCSDIYAVGMIGIQSLTGLAPPDQINTDENGEIFWRRWASQASPRLKDILDKMVRQNFKQRYQSADEVLQALKSLQLAEQKHRLNQKKTNLPRLIALAVIVIFTTIILNLSQKNYDYNLTNTAPLPGVDSNLSLAYRISFGEKILVKKEEVNTENFEFQVAKQRGVEAMLAGNYKQAVKKFEEALQKYRNAPETQIYLNNARIGKQKAYTIAVAVPIGNDLDGALESLRGVAQAQNEINQKGGINRVPLKVVVANDDGAPQIAKQIALELVKNPELLGVVGHNSSDVTLAAGEVYNSKKLAVISPASTSVKLSNCPDIFRTVPNDAFAATALAHYLRTNLQQKPVAVFYESKSEYSSSLKTEFTNYLKSEFEFAVSLNAGEVIDEIDLSEPGFSPKKTVERVIKKGEKVLLLAPTQDLLDKALQVVQVNRSKRLNLLGGDVLYSSRTLEVGGEDAVGMVVAIPWHIDSDPNSKFSRESRELWRADVNWLSAMSYDATQALIEALRRSENPDRASVQQALKDPDFSAQGVSGTIRFDKKTGDRRNAPIQLVKVCRGNRSGTAPYFAPVGLNCKI